MAKRKLKVREVDASALKFKHTGAMPKPSMGAGVVSQIAGLAVGRALVGVHHSNARHDCSVANQIRLADGDKSVLRVMWIDDNGTEKAAVVRVKV